MKFTIIKHLDSIFVLPTLWITVEDYSTAVSISWLTYSLNFEFETN